MSLLQQNSGQDIDDAARGESFTRGTSHIVWAAIVATILVTAAITAYVMAGQKPPAATGEVIEVWTHALHVTSPQFDAGGTAVPQDTYDQVLVFTHVRLHNQSKGPIFLHQIMTNANEADGIHTSYAATPTDFGRIFVAYPELKQWQAAPMPSDATIETGQTLEGTFVSSFRMTKADWDARKSLSYNFAFLYQPGLKLEYSGAITDR